MAWHKRWEREVETSESSIPGTPPISTFLLFFSDWAVCEPGIGRKAAWLYRRFLEQRTSDWAIPDWPIVPGWYFCVFVRSIRRYAQSLRLAAVPFFLFFLIGAHLIQFHMRWPIKRKKEARERFHFLLTQDAL